MTTIRIASAVIAGRQLVAAANRADTNGDGFLTTTEIRGSRRRIGAAATDALLREHAAHRAAVRRDPEIVDKAVAMRNMDINEVQFVATTGVAQLNRIDSYRGTRNPARPAGDRNGYVTDTEVANYHYSRGRLQVEASRLAAFTLDSRRR